MSAKVSLLDVSSRNVPSRPEAILQGNTITLLILFVLTATALMLFGGSVASPGIVILSAVVAYLLYRLSPVAYTSFVLWLFFLICFVRRIIDYRSGFSDQNIVLAAPLLAALVSAPTLIRCRHIWKRPISLPFALAFASSIYGILVGLLCLPAKILFVSSLEWLAPLVFGFFIFAEFVSGERHDAHMEALHKTFSWGLLVMGVYGIYQYVAAPAWDVLWMTGTGMNSIGSPEPFAIRVFSTMNGPGILAYTLVAGLVLIMSRGNLFSYCAGAFGFGALLLSSVRAAWVALIIAIILFLCKKKKYIARVMLVVAGASICAAIVIMVTPAHETILDRLNTFTDLSNDTSYQERTRGYSQLLPYAMEEPFGSGLGTMDAKFHDNISLGTRDSGFWEIILSLGWIGGAVYLLSLVMLAVRSWPHGKECSSEYTAAACITIGLLSQMALGSMMLGFTGLAIWSFGAMAMAQFGSRESYFKKGAQWLPDPATA